MKPAHHLSDEELQNFIGNKTVNDQFEIPVHLQTCSYCRNRLQNYDIVWAVLKEEYHLKPLSIDLASTVTQKIYDKRPQRSLAIEKVLYSIAGILILSGLLYCLSLLKTNGLSLSFLLMLAPIYYYIRLSLQETKVLSQKINNIVGNVSNT